MTQHHLPCDPIALTQKLKTRPDQWDDSLELWCMMQDRADEDEIYAQELNMWLSGQVEQCTVYLRDVLASPFRRAFRNREDRFAYFNAWCGVDTARHNVTHDFD